MFNKLSHFYYKKETNEYMEKLTTLAIYGVNNLGKTVLLGEKEFNCSLYCGKIRHPVQMVLTGGLIPKNTLSFNVTVLPEKEFKEK